MFNNVALDVVIGLVFVYLLYSLLGTLIQEMIASNIGLRGWVLNTAIKRMLDDDERNHGYQAPPKKLSELFYAHPLIKYLAPYNSFIKNKRPAYIDPETFSKVIIDLLRGQNIQAGSSDRQPIQDSLTDGKIAWDPNVSIEPETLVYLKSIWADAQGDVTKFKANLEQWFNEMMERTTGWYKKYTQLILLFVGLVIAGVFNVDTIKIIDVLKKNPNIRDQVIAQATAFSKAHPSLESLPIPIQSDSGKKGIPVAASNNQDAKKDLNGKLYNQAVQIVGSDINKVNNVLGLGWDGGDKFECPDSIIGLLLTALAISLGAPFWFDLLNKLMQLKSSVAPKEDAKPKSDPVVTPVKRVG